MENISEHIPRSLRSYLEQYGEQPDVTIERLENHLKKRGPDAVGYYLLAWFYHYQNRQSEAVRCAWKAKIFAPGSPVMESFPYYMSHPKKFDAWKPLRFLFPSRTRKQEEKHHPPISDLDSLISKLSSVESAKIRIDPNAEIGPDLSEGSALVEDIVTETLAGIHEKQGNLKAALNTWNRLAEIHPEKKEYCLQQIQRIEAVQAERTKE